MKDNGKRLFRLLRFQKKRYSVGARLFNYRILDFFAPDVSIPLYIYLSSGTIYGKVAIDVYELPVVFSYIYFYGITIV